MDSARRQLALVCFTLLTTMSASLECDPENGAKRPDADNASIYSYCSLDGMWVKRDCGAERTFNATLQRCVGQTNAAFDDFGIWGPQNQATVSVCGTGTPFLRLGSPVVCNPSVSSCPQSYQCTLDPNTGLFFCCTRGTTTTPVCPVGQATFIDTATGQSRQCAPPPAVSVCPVGFGCVLAGGARYQCCGTSFGCPANEAGFVQPTTGQARFCQVVDQPSTCPSGFICRRSASLNQPICCTNTRGSTGGGTCPGGGAPLSTASCSSTVACPTGYSCVPISTGVVRCCPTPVRCPAGEPLASASCSAAGGCPVGYECVTSGATRNCCPQQSVVCAAAVQTGSTCTIPQTPQPRFYFDNVNGGVCRQFSYTGCGGGANNFRSRVHCEQFCLSAQCPVGVASRSGSQNRRCQPGTTNACPQQYSCQLPLFSPNDRICCPDAELTCNEARNAGTQCVAVGALTVSRYYFNSATRQCQLLSYAGCGGNNNNFRTQQQCVQMCAACTVGSALADPNGNRQACSFSVPCPAGYACTDPNPTTGQSYCCPNADTVCRQAVSAGRTCVGQNSRIAWYYNTQSRACAQFTFLGCGGNSNRFASQTSCFTFCGAVNVASCPAGLTPYIPPGGSTARTCTINVPNTCPAGYTCLQRTASAQPVCCSGTPSCPSGQTPYTLPSAPGQVVACSPSSPNSCPASYACVGSANVPSFSLCCASACPVNSPSNGQACTVNAPNTCVAGYLCLRAGVGSLGSCCQTTPVCTAGAIPYYLPGTANQVQVCGALGTTGCPVNTVCQSSTVGGVSICCTQQSSALCPGNTQPYVPVGSAAPLPCAPGSVGVCPASYACQRATNGQFLCCPVTASAGRCATGMVPYYPPGQVIPQVCSVVAVNCPQGYSCQSSTIVGQYYCCPGTVLTTTLRPPSTIPQCPAGTNAYLMANLPLACPQGSTLCPLAYSCMQSSHAGQFLCCTGGGGGNTLADCLGGGVPYTMPGTAGRRQTCSPQSAVCPSGYGCQQSTLPAQYICCRGQSFSDYCPPNQNPLLTATNEPLQCVQNVAHNCAFDYTCTYSATHQLFYCCKPLGDSGGNADFCPAGQRPHIETGSTTPRLCNTRTNPCFQPYLCQYNSQRQQSYCCAVGGSGGDASGCPTGSQPALDRFSRVQTCPQGNDAGCPGGYRCVYSIPFLRWQCCAVAADSPVAPSDDDVARTSAADECDDDSALIGGECRALLYPGQLGCTHTEQCSLLVSDTACSDGLCVCPSAQLILDTRCVRRCPSGYIGAAGRCKPLSQLPFLSNDAVEDIMAKGNGTVGGWCLQSIVEKEQCAVDNAECNDVTCQCRSGFKLKLSDDYGERCVKSDKSTDNLLLL